MSEVTITKEAAAAKLASELEEAKHGNFPVLRIKSHLVNFMNNDTAFPALVMQPHKTLKKCVDHLFESIRKKYGGNCGVEDEEVYEICRSYYELDDAEIERKKAEEAAKRKAEADERAKARAQQKSAQAAKPAARQTPAPAPKKDGPEQMTLFEF